jgi:NAD(P)H-dependent flavin oxidoreductase YrpB (nitropropane dioxygenase family)
MKTPVADMLGIEFPIVAFSHCRDVVAAVTNAGGFGVLGAVAYGPDDLETALSWIDAEVRGRPYGVDVLIPAKYVGSEEGGISRSRLEELIPEEHRHFVDSLLEKYDVPPMPESGDGGEGGEGERSLTLMVNGAERLVEVALGHPIRLIANALGPAPADMIEAAHARDVVVASLVGTRQHAERQQATGVDIIVAQGYEAGGHTGEIGTMVLVPEVVEAVAPTPVLAAGGIATGRQMLAAFALGAQGVWCGSVWLTTQEAETHPVVKEKFLKASTSDTVRSRSTTGKPARQLRSAWTDEWADPANPDPLPMPLQPLLIADAQRRVNHAAATNPGANQLVNYFVGQVVGRMNQVKASRQVVMDMVEEFIDSADEINKILTTTPS